MKAGTSTVEVIDMETPSPPAAGNLYSGKKRKRTLSGATPSPPLSDRQKKPKPSPARQSHGMGCSNLVRDPATTDLNQHHSDNADRFPMDLLATSPGLSPSSAESETETGRRRKLKGKARRLSHSSSSGTSSSHQDFEATMDGHPRGPITPVAELQPLQEVSTNCPRAQTMPPTALNTSAPFLARHSFVSTGDVEKLFAQAECKIKANMLKELKILTTATNQPTAMSSSISMPPPPRPVTGSASASTNVPRLLPPSLLRLPLDKHLEDEVVGLIKDPLIKGPTRVMRAGWAFTIKGDLRSNLLHCQSIQSRLNDDELAKVTPRKKLRRHITGPILGPVPS